MYSTIISYSCLPVFEKKYEIILFAHVSLRPNAPQQIMSATLTFFLFICFPRNKETEISMVFNGLRPFLHNNALQHPLPTGCVFSVFLSYI